MTEQKAICMLRDLYEHAPEGMKAVAPILFGLKYADELAGHSLARIAAQGSRACYDVELRYGVKLAEYVTLDRPLWREQRSR